MAVNPSPAFAISAVTIDIDRKLPFQDAVEFPEGGVVLDAYASRVDTKLQALDGSKLAAPRCKIVLVVEHVAGCSGTTINVVVMRDGVTFPKWDAEHELDAIAVVGHPLQGFPIVVYQAIPRSLSSTDDAAPAS